MPLKSFRILLVIFLILAAPAFAEQHEPAADAAEFDLAAMQRLGSMTARGVVATAYLTAVDDQDTSGATHQVVVTFSTEKRRTPVEDGLVGIKHRRLYGDTSEAVWMRDSETQPGLFSAGISLDKSGTYLLIVGTKLEDDKKRQFTFEYLHR